MNFQNLITRIKNLTSKDKKTITQRLTKLAEETGELAKEINIIDEAPGCTYRDTNPEDALEEACDVIIVASSILCHLDYNEEEFENMMNKKLDKWADVLTRDKK